MSELNERLLKKFKDNITISNLKEECIMKKNTRKHVLLATMLTVLVLSGSLVTVDASTDGQLVKNIKDTVKVIFVKDEKEKEINGKEYIDKDGEHWVNYEKNVDGSQMKVDINKDELEKENIQVDVKMTTDENESGSITIMELENN